MKRLISIILLIAISDQSFTQPQSAGDQETFSYHHQADSTNFEKLLKLSSDFYLSQVKYSNDFYEGLLRVTKWCLTPENSLFKATCDEFLNASSAKDELSLYYLVGDSILRRIRSEYLWKDREIECIKYKDIYALYNEAFCSCITDTNISPEELKKYGEYYDFCYSQLARNVLFMTKFQKELDKIPFDQKTLVQSLISRYAYKECSSFSRYINKIMSEKIRSNIEDHIFSGLYHLQETILDLYNRKNYDSVKQLFPFYLANKKDIELTKLLDSQGFKNMRRQERRGPDKDTIIFTTTFYNKLKSVVFKGQTVCTVYGMKSLTPKMINLRYISPDKIKDKAGLIKEIDKEIELPPPPAIEMKKQ